jgi:Na+/proline symporter
VQRLLATRSLGHARAALIGSGIAVFLEFVLFLMVGVAVWAAAPELRSMPGDAIFPAFIVNNLPAGLSGLVVAGILAAAMGSTSSALNSLASATTHDYYAPLRGRVGDDRHLLRAGRLFTLAWAALLIGGALLFPGRDTPVVVVALSIASLTYGALLGAFILARFERVRERDVVIALVAASLAMSIVVFAGPIGRAVGEPGWLMTLARLAWPWYVPLGTLLTVVTGLACSVTARKGK